MSSPGGRDGSQVPPGDREPASGSGERDRAERLILEDEPTRTEDTPRGNLRGIGVGTSPRGGGSSSTMAVMVDRDVRLTLPKLPDYYEGFSMWLWNVDGKVLGVVREPDLAFVFLDELYDETVSFDELLR